MKEHTLKFEINDTELPTADETVYVDLGGGYSALVDYTPPLVEPEPTVQAPEAFYAVASIPGPTVVHAVMVTHRGVRYRADRYTVCSKTDSRRSGGHRKDMALTAVTCRQCIGHLQEEGVL